MTWIDKILTNKQDNGLKLKFSKTNDTWMVVKNRDIVFMGAEEQCKAYIENFKDTYK